MTTNGARPTLTLYGGVGTIGGTKAVVAEGGYRVIFDFGSAFMPGAPGNPFDYRLEPRPGDLALRDQVLAGVLPPLGGIYQPSAARLTGLAPGADGTTAVFISHMHLDHMAHLDMLAPDLPVHLSEDSSKLLRALLVTGEPQGAGCRRYPWIDGEAIKVGPITVRPLPVDHDVIGASALLIETSAGVVAYSGDLRLHGAHPERTRAFMAAAAAARPAVLLLEGTRAGEEPEEPPRRSLREPEVGARVAEICRLATGLAIISQYRRNVERVQALAEAARTAGRTLVLEPETAYVLQTVTGSLHGARVYRRGEHRLWQVNGTVPEWLEPLLADAVVPADISLSPEAFLLDLRYRNLAELHDLAVGSGAVYIHSNGEPLGRYDPAYANLRAWLDRHGIAYDRAYSSGHASPDALVEIAQSIAPKRLLPIHSLEPELLAPPAVPRLLPAVGVTYSIAALASGA